MQVMPRVFYALRYARTPALLGIGVSAVTVTACMAATRPAPGHRARGASPAQHGVHRADRGPANRQHLTHATGVVGSGEGVDAGELRGQRPQAGGLIGVDRVVADAGTGVVADGGLGDVAVLAVDPAQPVELW
jgi:hypothetical protein